MSRTSAPTGPEPLTGAHRTEHFTCGKPALDTFLKRFALINQQNGTARSYVAQRNGDVVAYYSLSAASVEVERTPARVSKGLPKHPIPMTLLARLAVDSSEQGHGLGASLLQDALLRHLQAEAVIGSRALIVHAKDETAVAFYRKFGFAPSPLDPLHLFLLTKDIKKTLGF